MAIAYRSSNPVLNNKFMAALTGVETMSLQGSLRKIGFLLTLTIISSFATALVCLTAGENMFLYAGLFSTVGAFLERSALYCHQSVNRNALRMGIDRRQHLQHRGSVLHRFPHTNDAAAAESHTRLTHPLKRLQTFLEGPRRDDFVVVLRAGIKVVVVGR